MRVTFLGTGAAGGVPLYGCACLACLRAENHPKYVRRPCSALIETASTRLLLDAGLMDLHQRLKPNSLDAIVLTHYHADHVQGLFHLRWGVGEPINVFGPPDSEGCADLYKHPGILRFAALKKFTAFTVGDLRITPLPLIHSKPTLGYAIEGPNGERFAYLTDTLGLPPKTEAFLSHWGPFAMALDCSFAPGSEPRNHNDWHTALATIAAVNADQAWLTHIGHGLDSWLISETPQRPSYIHIARDNQCIELSGYPRSDADGYAVRLVADT